MRISDWSSDVCSSDLLERERVVFRIVDGEVALDADVAGHVVEIVVQAQRPAPHAVDHAQLAADFVGGDDAPGRRILEAVEEAWRSEEHTSELQSLMRHSYAVSCLKTKKQLNSTHTLRSRHDDHY